MRRLNFNDYLFELLLENKSNELNFKLSDRLFRLLRSMFDQHTIAEKLIDLHNDVNPSDVTLIDFDDTNLNLFTFATSSRLYDYIEGKFNLRRPNAIKYYVDNIEDNDDLWKKFRSPIRIGRFINRVFPGQFDESGKEGQDIQSFVDLVKTKRTEYLSLFKIVEGSDLVKYYRENSYSKERGLDNQLLLSCMRYDKCSDYMDFYTDNGVKMLVLMSSKNEGKIIGRALIWELSEPQRTFMDRIYTVYDHDIQRFKDYAIQNNWLFKRSQNNSPRESIFDPSDNSNKFRTLKIENFEETKKFPYLDTLCFFFYEDNVLTNDDTLDFDYLPYKIQRTDGGYKVGNSIYIDYYDELVDEDDLIWCDIERVYRKSEDVVSVAPDDVYVTTEYADQHFHYSELMDKYINTNARGVIHLRYYDEFVTERFARNNLVQNTLYDDYLSRNDAFWSEYHNSYIPKDESIEIINKYPSGDLYNDYAHEDYKKDFIEKGGIYYNLTEEEFKKYNK